MKNTLSFAAISMGLSAVAAQAQQNLEIIGVPVDRATGFQPAVTELASDIQWLDGMLMVIITAISLFVVGLLAWVVIRYNSKRNPEPASFTHHTPVEIAWTLAPALILFFIGAFSLPILFKQQEIPEADVTIKATGYQWYWDYEYIEHGFEFSSYMIGAPSTGGNNAKTPEVIEQLEAAGYSEAEFLLATDTSVVVPVNKTIVMQVTGGDVIHAWTIPAFGVKQDAVPGRLAELWFKAEQEGIYFGQCSELCGLNHAYMPITVKVVSEAEYEAWLEEAREEYAGVPQTRVIASK
ncbi:MAG: cytochrome c oxidase subunit II [Pseudomonadota bacterium]